MKISAHGRTAGAVLAGLLYCVSLAAVALLTAPPAASARSAELPDSKAHSARREALLGLLEGSRSSRLDALEDLGRYWSDHLTPALLEFVSLTSDRDLQLQSLLLVQTQTGVDNGFNLNDWFAWVWQQNFEQPSYYAEFKSRLYGKVDSRFAEYFAPQRTSTIQLDEVRWGGVLQDGIPPLRDPAMITAADADYLTDDNVVFGLVVNGDARAYPKRILAWHEMFVDTVGGVPVTGVYCTLCGSMILYDSTADGVEYTLGTSGFLYRSNKLMYDKATQSLWNTLWGRPVIGPLAGKDITLPRRSVVTTTWGEWRRRHPRTTVLSLDTGFRRDYGEGVAYQEYFATDNLMFNTSEVDDRLPNKAEVLGLVFADGETRPLAIAAAYGRENPMIQERAGPHDIVIVTDTSGAMRAYHADGIRFRSWDRDRALTDASGTQWTLHEDRLVAGDGQELARIPSHNAFWFGWYGAYTNTRLLK